MLKDNFIKELLKYKEEFYSPLPSVYLSGISEHAYNLKHIYPDLSDNMQYRYKKIKEKYGEFKFDVSDPEHPILILSEIENLEILNKEEAFTGTTSFYISDIGFYVDDRDKNKLRLRIKNFKQIDAANKKISRGGKYKVENIIDYDDTHFDLENDLEFYVIECVVFFSRKKDKDGNIDYSNTEVINGFAIPTVENFLLISNYGHLIQIYIDEFGNIKGRFRRSDAFSGKPKKVEMEEPKEKDYENRKDEFKKDKEIYDNKIKIYNEKLKKYKDAYLGLEFSDPESTTPSKTKTNKTHLFESLMGIKNDNLFKYNCINHKDSNRKNPSLKDYEWCTSLYNSYESTIRNKRNKAIVIYDENNNVICGLKIFQSLINFYQNRYITFIHLHFINKDFVFPPGFKIYSYQALFDYIENLRSSIEKAVKNSKKYELIFPIKDDNDIYKPFKVYIDFNTSLISDDKFIF